MKETIKKIVRTILIIVLITFIICCITVISLYFAYKSTINPKTVYYNEDFNFNTYTSQIDKDGDGIDDQTDILENAKKYVSNKPIYKSEYYDTGYNDGKVGVCTDVIAYALLNSGYDIMNLVKEDVASHLDEYPEIEVPDYRIDFRRVKNLNLYFNRTAISLTLDLEDHEAWQGGDIVVFKTHIGIISDKRNSDGIPYLIHHANPYQTIYEENILMWYQDQIIGHFRIS